MTLDAKSLAVVEFLTALQECLGIFRELEAAFRQHPEVRSVGSRGWPQFAVGPFDIYRESGGVERFHFAVMFLLSADLKSKRVMEWTLCIYRNEAHWLVETIAHVDSDAPRAAGMDTLRNFPERYAETLDELIVQVKAAARELVENVDAIDETVAMDVAATADEAKN